MGERLYEGVGLQYPNLAWKETTYEVFSSTTVRTGENSGVAAINRPIFEASFYATGASNRDTTIMQRDTSHFDAAFLVLPPTEYRTLDITETDNIDWRILISIGVSDMILLRLFGE